MAPAQKQYRVAEIEVDGDAVFAEIHADYSPIQVVSPISSVSRQSGTTGKILPFTALLWTIVSLVSHIADVLSDVYVSGKYFFDHNYWWSGFALGFVVIASLVIQIFSAKWFYDDGKRQNCVNYLLHVLQLGPFIRYWTALKICLRSRRQGGLPQARELFIAEWRDLSMLRLLQAFLQSAPQLVLQLYVLARRGEFTLNSDLGTAASAVTSLISIVWAILCYSKALRDMRSDPGDLPFLGFIFQMLWRTSMITSRIVALVLFASYFQHWMFVAAAAHWFLMALWLSCQRTQFCIDETGKEHPCREKLFNAMIAFIYIFCFFNTKEGMTRKRVVLFYSVMLVENSLLISMWYPQRTISTKLTYIALSIVWGGFVLGVIFMILYYRFYHHSHRYKGMFLRIRKFEKNDREMYGLYCCCCCRIRKWEPDTEEYNDQACGDPRLLANRPLDEAQEAVCANVPSPPLIESSQPRFGLRWDEDQRPLLRDRDDAFRVLVHNRGEGAGRELEDVDEEEEVPDIIVTAATPTTMSPHESPRNTKQRTPVVHKDRETPVPEREVRRTEERTNSTSQRCTSADVARRILADKLDSHDEETYCDSEDIPKINYGTLSFSNRYSLVSSDCISLSSASSASSFNSLNDMLDSFQDEGEELRVLKTPNADEGIFSDERESPEKSSDSVPGTFETCPTSSESNAMERICEDNDPINLDEVEKSGMETVERIMDAPSSPFHSRKTSQSSGKGEGFESDSTESSSEGNFFGGYGQERHSCGTIYDPEAFTTDEDSKKRHSFDIAELTRKSRKFKKRERERKRRRHGKLITFDNFVPSPLKAGRFGSLRKSFERLSKIQEDGEDILLMPLQPARLEEDGTVTERISMGSSSPNSEQNDFFENRQTHKPNGSVRDRNTSPIRFTSTTIPENVKLIRTRIAEREKLEFDTETNTAKHAVSNGKIEGFNKGERMRLNSQVETNEYLTKGEIKRFDDEENMRLDSQVKTTEQWANGRIHRQNEKEMNDTKLNTTEHTANGKIAVANDPQIRRVGQDIFLKESMTLPKSGVTPNGKLTPNVQKLSLQRFDISLENRPPIPALDSELNIMLSPNSPRIENHPSEPGLRSELDIIKSPDLPSSNTRNVRSDENQNSKPINMSLCQQHDPRTVSETNKPARDSDNSVCASGDASPELQRLKHAESDQQLAIERTSSPRQSRDNVPLACADDEDDLGEDSISDPESVLEARDFQGKVADTSAKSLFSDSSKDFCAEADLNLSSGSSICENLLISSELIRESTDSTGQIRTRSGKRRLGFEEFSPSNFNDFDDMHSFHSDKRHTFAFGTTGRDGEMVRIVNGSTHKSLPLGSPDDPIWVHNPGVENRRRRPQSTVSADAPLQEDVIQEIPV